MNNHSLQKKTGRRIPFVAWLGYLLLVTLVVTGVTFSGYVSKSGGEDSARVAKFDVTEKFVGETTAELTGMYPGSTAKEPLTFTVTNKSEVTVACYMILESTENMPLDYYVINGEKETPIALGEKTQFATLQPNQGNATTFTLQAKWPNTPDSVWVAESYMYESDAITLTLITEQVD